MISPSEGDEIRSLHVAETTIFFTPGGEWNVAHSLALFEQEDVLCVSDRENAKIDCMKAGLRWPIDGPVDRDETGVAVITYTGVGNTYAIAAKGNTTTLHTHTYMTS